MQPHLSSGAPGVVGGRRGGGGDGGDGGGERLAGGILPFRQFAGCADEELLAYLEGRNVSRFFLNEIDQFLAAHPEIARHRADFADAVNNARPLEAYRKFIRGYARPARYVDGALPHPNSIPLLGVAMPLAYKQDTELNDFFAGETYRTDILARIDEEVEKIANALSAGQTVSYEGRKLLIFARFGNPVDAYKFYEYRYQKEWLPHHHMLEHVILQDIPKAADYTELAAYYESDGSHQNMLSWPETRARMAAAKACREYQIDVIDVLFDDFASTLARLGLSRREIEHEKREARRALDHHFSIRGTRDIVDLVMNRVPIPTQTLVQTPVQTPFESRQRVLQMGHQLSLLITREATFYDDGPDPERDANTEERRRIERELVFEATQQAYDTDNMSRADMMEWRSMFTPEAQLEREEGGYGRRIDVLRDLGLSW